MKVTHAQVLSYFFLTRKAIFVLGLLSVYYLKLLIDLALIKINPPLKMTDKVQMVRINQYESNLSGRMATISGWGRTESTYYPNHLKKADIEITRNHDGIIDFETSYDLQSACKGDSGGGYRKINHRFS